MSANSKIEWTDHTFNPWIGCTNVSPACDNCYAAAQDKFRRWTLHGWGGPRRRTSATNWNLPKRWNDQHEAFLAQHGRRQRVFCASLADVFDNQVEPAWRADLFELIEATPHLDWLLLTKRIGNAWKMMADACGVSMASARLPLSNVWLGATICDQEEANRDIPKLLAVPARVRFLSIEPMLGPVHLEAAVDLADTDGTIDWVIVGGESGSQARPMHPEWARSLRDECEAFGTPFLFKQWGEWLPISQQLEEFTQRLYRSNRKARLHENQGALDDCYGRTCTVEQAVIHEDGSVHAPLTPMAFRQGTGAMLTFKAGKKAAGRLLDGGEWNEVPAP